MDRDVRAYVEMELENYNDTRRELAELINDILEASPPPPDGMPRGSTPGDPTAQKATRLTTSKRIQYLEQTIKAIESVVDNLDPERLRLVELRYWQRPRRYTDEGIALKLNVSRMTMYRWNVDICRAVAVRLGVLPLRKRCYKDVTNRGV